MSTKKIVALLVLITTLLVSVVGCGSKEVKTNDTGKNSTQKTDEKPKKTQTISYAFWSTDQEPAFKAIVEKFEAENPDIKVKLEITPWSEYWTKLEAAATGGVMPDVFWMHANQVVKYAGNEMLMDIGSLVKDDPQLDFGKYPEGVVNTYKIDGHYYAIPKDYDVIALFYNKKIFDEAGIAYPDSSWDWDKTVEVAKQLTDASKGVWGFAAPNTSHQGYYNFIYQNGGYVISDDKTESGFGMPETIEAIQWYKDMVDVHKVSPTQEQFADTSALALFSGGKIAMLPLGSWKITGLMANEDIKDDFDIAVLPKGKKRATIYNGLGYAIAANTKYPEATRKFLAYLGSEEANLIQAEKGAAIPAYEGTQQPWMDLFSQYNVKAFAEMLEYGVQLPASKTKSKWEQLEKDIMIKAFAGKVTMKEAGEAIADGMNKNLATEK